MAITKLPVNFQDDIIDTAINDKRRYRLEENADGTISLEDVTTYKVVGSYYGMEQTNATNGTVNQLIDKTEAVEAAVENANNKDFFLTNQLVIAFENNVAVINDARITQDSLADVYFTQDTYNVAENAVISVETFSGYVKLTAGRTPEGIVRATIHIRVV